MNKYVSRRFLIGGLLLTLLVISIVLAIITPKIMANYEGSGNISNKTEEIEAVQYIDKWKSAYAKINQAGLKILVKNGGTLKGLCHKSDSWCFKDKFKPYLSVLTECSSSVSGKCWHKMNGWKELNGNDIGGSFGAAAAGLVLSDESLIVFSANDIYIDVNGFTPPNTVGLDIFLLTITDSSIKPYGTNTASCQPGSTDPNNLGYACAAKYLSD